MLLVLQDFEVLPKPGEQLGGVLMLATMALRKRALTCFGTSIPLDQLHAAIMLSKHLGYKINVTVLTSTQDDGICGRHSALSGIALATRTQDG
jgi:hypothetical protein